ncbi:MAG TPA: hypothetical protein VLB89_04350 [Gaiellaceae bacterium]|nr:hypothetical protein [Gaiellaceae bacterium]
MLAVCLAAACSSGGGRPAHLLDGRPAPELRPVRNSVIAASRLLERADVQVCQAGADRTGVASDAPVVERTGVDDHSITFASRDGSRVYACDGGIDPAGERAPPWCGGVVGERERGRLLDPRLDVVCHDRQHRPLAYAFVEPVARAGWIGVRQDGFVELYDVVAGLPVRVASRRGIDLENARAVFDVTQYDAAGRELVREELEAAVAG